MELEPTNSCKTQAQISNAAAGPRSAGFKLCEGRNVASLASLTLTFQFSLNY